jgi:tyrosinase
MISNNAKGIHGRPYQSFDGVQAAPGDSQNGFCTHVSILFPTWHRPFLALYEQVLYDLIQYIASLWPAGSERDEYVAAATIFRIPYWDWAAVPPAGQSVLPDSVGGSAFIMVNGPNGEQEIENPLFSYIFKPLNTSQLPDPPVSISIINLYTSNRNKFDLYPQTMRYPTTEDSSAASQNNILAEEMDINAASFRGRLFNLFTNYHDYTDFSNEAWIPTVNPEGYDSIESIHDQIHGITGGGGHMSYIEYSAFDPVFFLHHAMIDRIFSMWQVINPNSYVVPEPSTYSTFTMTSGQTQDATTPLTPFFEDLYGTFWTSNSVRSTRKLGYAYPETAGSENITAQVIFAVNSLYGTTTASSKHQKREKGVVSGHLYREWIVNIRVEKNALTSPFFIHVFLGPVEPDSSTWATSPSLVGSHFIFTKSLSSTCRDCDPSQMVSGSIPITTFLLSLVDDGKLASPGPSDVEPFIMRNFQYRIKLANGTEVANCDVPSLKLSIVSADVTVPVDNWDLPKWGAMRGSMDVEMGS